MSGKFAIQAFCHLFMSVLAKGKWIKVS